MKQFDKLIEGFRLVRNRHRAGLLILGDGPERRRLVRLAISLGLGGDCRFAGEVPEPRAFMAESACLAVTSRSEGFPNVVLEALSCRLPVVSFSWSNLRRNGSGIEARCRLVPQGNIEELAKALSAVLEESRLQPRGSRTGLIVPVDPGIGAKPADYEREFLELMESRTIAMEFRSAPGGRP